MLKKPTNVQVVQFPSLNLMALRYQTIIRIVSKNTYGYNTLKL